MIKSLIKFAVLLILSVSVSACVSRRVEASNYAWNEVTANAAFPQSYGFPVFVVGEKMFAFHQEAIWKSADGANWTKIDLPSIRRDAYATRYVQFNDAVYAFGQNQGNYLDGIKFGSTVRRTTDFKRWETLAEKSNFPNRVFYGTFVFGGKIWLIGGYDGKNYFNDVWNSADGVRWTRVVERAAWSPRNAGVLIEFKNRIWMFGGGVIDGMTNKNPSSTREIWSSVDGVNWTRAAEDLKISTLGTPVVFDDKLWLVGANRNDGNFARSSLVSDDAQTWREETAPWSPRGAVAVWVFGDKLFMTGGKYSYQKNGEPIFVYSNDVWAMSKKTE